MPVLSKEGPGGGRSVLWAFPKRTTYGLVNRSFIVRCHAITDRVPGHSRQIRSRNGKLDCEKEKAVRARPFRSHCARH